MNSINHEQFLASCCTITRDAGALIMRYFSDGFTATHKEDKSPVTEADIAANTLIMKALQELAPDIAIIAEEDETTQGAQRHRCFWLVDPLDGTRSFVRGESEFTVNIGLIYDHQPLLGVIYSPVHGSLYYGGVGIGAFRELKGEKAEPISCRSASEEGPVLVRSRSKPSNSSLTFLQSTAPVEVIQSSSSIKFCMVAEGSADVYPRFGRTMEWDTAAGHAIVNAAGGSVVTVSGDPLLYGKPGYENPGFIVRGL
jgi:3'(2'), 5'-bisphosphate nucleotidase